MSDERYFKLQQGNEASAAPLVTGPMSQGEGIQGSFPPPPAPNVGTSGRPLLNPSFFLKNLHPVFNKFEAYAKSKLQYIPVISGVSRDTRCPLLARMLALLALSYSTAPFPLVPHQLKYIGGLDMVTIAPVLIAASMALKPTPEVSNARREASQRMRPAFPVCWLMGVVFMAIWALAPLMIISSIPSLFDWDDDVWGTICFILYIIGIAYYYVYAKRKYGGTDFDLSADLGPAAPSEDVEAAPGVVVGYPVGGPAPDVPRL